MKIHALFGLSLLAIATMSIANATETIQVPERIASAKKLVFCTEIAFPPWEWIDPATQQPVGFDIDIAAAVAKQLGVVNEHKNIGFDGLIPALQAGQCDAIISELFDKPARREVVDFANYAKTGTSMVLRFDSAVAAQTVDELSGLKVAVGIGTTGETVLAEANERLKAAGKTAINVIVLQSSTEAFQQLMAGLVDAYISTPDQAAYYNTQTPNSVKLTGAALDEFPTGIAVRKDDTELHKAIEAALANMREDGTYQAILDKWSFQALAFP
jgi:polar amino acid transport system substrate-binding protein